MPRIGPRGPGKGDQPTRGGRVRTRIRGARESAEELKVLRRRVGTLIIRDSQQRASAIQARLQAAAGAEYHRAATGRFARGLRAKAVNTGSPGEKVQSVIRITMINYKESKFLTNIAGSGYFKDFPVRKYRIFAKGAEGAEQGIEGRSLRYLARVARAGARSRLKVPKDDMYLETFFKTSQRFPRGNRGGESRRISQEAIFMAGPGAATRNRDQFFYPLWVTHPEIKRDIVSEVAIAEGAKWQTEILTAVTQSHGELRTKSMVAGRDIPLTGQQVNVTKLKGSELVSLGRKLEDRRFSAISPDFEHRFVEALPID